MLEISSQLSIPDEAIQYRFVRSSGPGGQNVNKVATAVELRLDLERSTLPKHLQHRVHELAGQRGTSRQEVVIFAQRFRTQARNRADADERLIALIRRAMHRAKPRLATRPSKSVRNRRLDRKGRRGALKRLRGKAPPDA